MKLLTKNTDYAIRALLALGRFEQEFISVKTIAQEQKIPYEYLRKIFQQLLKEGFVESRGGGRGGFRLIRHPGQIVVAEVIRIFQGDLQLSECLFRKKFCHNRAHCVLRKNIQRIEAMVNQEFGAMTIQGLLDDMEGGQ